MTTAVDLTAHDAGTYAIDTGYVRPRMDASHLVVHNGRAAFVDTGTDRSVPSLLAALDLLGVARDAVDYVFVTHVHLDHAGGAGGLIDLLPNAAAVLHPRGARHMIDPSRLEAGTRDVYGDEAFEALYGTIRPIPEDRVRTVEDGEVIELAGRPFEFMHTEGHARHHYCMHDLEAGAVFSGDTFGVSYRELDTDQGAFILPSTTPVQFDPEAAHRSIDRLVALAPDGIYLTHYSRVENIAKLAADLHGDLDAIVALAEASARADDPEAEIAARLGDHLYGRLERHGCRLPEVEFRHILEPDIMLNASGIAFWLARRDG